VLHLRILWPDVKGCLDAFFTTVNIETRSKEYFKLLFTSDIPSADVKSLLISDICTSDEMVC
jgi:hypothetical protein